MSVADRHAMVVARGVTAARGVESDAGNRRSPEHAGIPGLHVVVAVPAKELIAGIDLMVKPDVEYMAELRIDRNTDKLPDKEPAVISDYARVSAGDTIGARRCGVELHVIRCNRVHGEPGRRCSRRICRSGAGREVTESKRRVRELVGRIWLVRQIAEVLLFIQCRHRGNTGVGAGDQPEAFVIAE